MIEFPRYPPCFVWHERKKFYRLPSGLCVPAVTSILSATLPESDRQQLEHWKHRVGHQTANQISRESAERGRALHQRIERSLNRFRLPPCPSNLRPWRDSIAPVLKQLKKVLLVEGMVFHEELGYAGTADAIALWQDECICLFDWKTAKSWRKNEWLTTYKLQVAALWGAVQATYNLRLEKALIAIAIPNQPAQEVWLSESDLDCLWRMWTERFHLWQKL